MKKVRVTVLKNKLSHYLRLVKARPSLEILKHPPVPCKADAVQALIEERRRR